MVKKPSIVKIFFSADGSVGLNCSIAFDYGFLIPQGVSSSTTQGAAWDTATWDVAEWAGILGQELNFFLSGLGTNVSLQLSCSIQGQQFNWYSSIFNYQIASSAF